jgi:hypothetical protein
MRATLACLLLLVLGCGPEERGLEPDAPPLPCEDMICLCAQQGKPPTSVSGTVFAPNGTLPLYGATVYIPREDPGPLADGVVCDRCEGELPGGSVVHAVSNDAGEFTLTNVPPGMHPLVVQIGKWRRRTTIDVVACEDNQVPTENTRLPRNQLEGDLPRIAIATGRFDALECLVRKLGVEVDEFTSATGAGRIHLYASNGATSSVTDAATFLPATTLWGDRTRLESYDLALFSCEGEPLPNQKTQAMMDNLKAYADLGGRVFLSHYHAIWIVGETNNPSHAPAVWPSIARCDRTLAAAPSSIIDQTHNPKGRSFARWMSNVGGSSSFGIIPVSESRQTCSTVDLTRAERWVVSNVNAQVLPQVFQFTTPNEVDLDERCGKVVFSDMHVASGSSSTPGTPFPNGCNNGPLTPQEKALAFMFFDIASCVALL